MFYLIIHKTPLSVLFHCIVMVRKHRFMVFLKFFVLHAIQVRRYQDMIKSHKSIENDKTMVKKKKKTWTNHNI